MAADELDPTAPRFVDARHELFAGWIAGHAIRAGLDVVPVVDDAGDYLPALDVRGAAVPIRLVIPAPPPGWTLAAALDADGR